MSLKLVECKKIMPRYDNNKILSWLASQNSEYVVMSILGFWHRKHKINFHVKISLNYIPKAESCHQKYTF